MHYYKITSEHVIDHAVVPRYARPFSLSGPLDTTPDAIINEAATHLYRTFGSHINWPVDIEVFANGNSLGISQIDLMNEPEFIVTPCTPMEANA